jgi:flagellar basal-body rod protein FlgB
MVREILFGNRSVEMLRRGLDAGAARMKAIAENIAHVETPGYRAQRVVFEELLDDARREQLALRRSHAAHLSAGPASGAEVPRPRTERSATAPAAGAINNVEIERELVQLQKNEVQFQALSQALANKYRGIRDAIRPSS